MTEGYSHGSTEHRAQSIYDGLLTFVKGLTQYNSIYCKIVIALFILAVIPLIIISFYNHPSADDFTSCAGSRNVWLETHSIGAVINEAVKKSVSLWHNWGGIYAAAFFQALQPAIFGEQYYAIAGILMIAILILGNVIVSLYFVERVMGGEKLTALCIAFFMSFAMLEWMPSPVEGIYWFNGAVNYTPCFTGLMMLLVLMTEIQRTFGKGRIKRGGTRLKIVLLSIAVVAVEFLVGGGNQMCSFSGAFGMFIIVAVSIYVKRDKCLAVLDIVLFLAMFAFFCLNILAPGTAVRSAIFDEGRPSAIAAIFMSIRYGCMCALQWFSPRVICLMLVSLPVVLPLVAGFCRLSTFSFRMPALVLAASIAWISALFCPPVYGRGSPGVHSRIGNWAYYFCVVLFFLNEIYIAGFIYKTAADNSEDVKAVCGTLSKSLGGASCRIRIEMIRILLLLALAAAIGNTVHIAKTTSTTRAIGSLLSGKAKRYSDENYERIKVYQANKGMDAAVKEFSKKPGLLFFNDITEDTNDWINISVSRYYALNSVVLLPKGDE